MSFPFSQPLHRLAQRQILHPALFLIFLIADLIHHIKRVPALRVNGLKQAHRALDGVQRGGDILAADADLRRDLVDGGLPQILFRHMFPGINRLVGRVPQRPAHPDGIVVPQIPADLPDDHGHCVCGKLHLQFHVEIVNGFDQTDAADLKQVVHIFITGGKPLDDAKNQPQIPFNEDLPGLFVPADDPLKQGVLLLVGQKRQLCGVHSTDFDFIHSHDSILLVCFMMYTRRILTILMEYTKG